MKNALYMPTFKPVRRRHNGTYPDVSLKSKHHLGSYCADNDLVDVRTDIRKDIRTDIDDCSRHIRKVRRIHPKYITNRCNDIGLLTSNENGKD